MFDKGSKKSLFTYSTGYYPGYMGHSYFDNDYKNYKNQKYISGVESRNSKRAFNSALGFADKMFFQGPYAF